MPSVRFHNRPGSRRPKLLQAGAHPSHVAGENGFNESIDHRRGAALVFPPDWCNLMRERQRNLWKPAFQEFLQGQLMLRIQVGKQETNRDRRILSRGLSQTS